MEVRHEYLQPLSKDKTELLCTKDYFSNRKLNAVTVENGFILPPIFWKWRVNNPYNPEGSLHGEGGVIDANNNYIELSAQKAEGMNDRVLGKYDISKFQVEHIHENVIYMNFYIHQWGHFLVDVIGRLWYAATIDRTTKIAYTCYMGQEDAIVGNYLELLSLFGIDADRLILVNKVTQFDRIIVPEMAIYPGAYFTREYKSLFDIAVSNVDCMNKEGKKIYCSRRKLKKADFREHGEEGIEKVFVDNGFESVYMERISLIEQIKLLNSSEEIALVNGSLAHNLLFLRTPAKVYIINKTYRYNLHQFLINQICEANVVYIDAYVAPLPVLYGYGPFFIKRTDSFLRFCSDNKFVVKETPENNEKLSIAEKLWYYSRYLYLYRRFLLTHEIIQENIYGEGEIPRKVIRNYYKESQKGTIL